MDSQPTTSVDLLLEGVVNGQLSAIEAERLLNAAARLKAGVPTGNQGINDPGRVRTDSSAESGDDTIPE